MPTKILVTEAGGTPKQLVFADHGGDFSPAAADDLRDPTSGNRTTVNLSLASVANNAARQSDKADLGTDFAGMYAVRAAFEFAATPTAGNTVELYWAPSLSGTAANGNAGGVSGANAAYSGYSSNLDASVRQLQPIGNFVCTAQATATVQKGVVGYFMPPTRYGTLVVYDKSGAAFHSDDVECHVVFDPVVFEVQN